jgi:predicted HTH transcriptional regulator
MDIERILQTGETQSVEFKKSLSQKKEGCKALCGMLNTEIGAGMVLFGISPENDVVGIGGNLDSAQRTLAQHIQQKFDPSIVCSIKIEDYKDKKILVLSAKRANDVSCYEYDGRVFIKEGSTKRYLSAQEKKSLNDRKFDEINYGPWKCDKCGSFVGILSSIVITKEGPKKSYKCDCGGEYWPINHHS